MHFSLFHHILHLMIAFVNIFVIIFAVYPHIKHFCPITVKSLWFVVLFKMTYKKLNYILIPTRIKDVLYIAYKNQSVWIKYFLSYRFRTSAERKKGSFIPNNRSNIKFLFLTVYDYFINTYCKWYCPIRKNYINRLRFRYPFNTAAIVLAYNLIGTCERSFSTSTATFLFCSSIYFSSLAIKTNVPIIIQPIIIRGIYINSSPTYQQTNTPLYIFHPAA